MAVVTVYADVLTALNILITYITIVASRLVLKAATNKYAVALASLIGGFSSLVIFYDTASVAFSVFYKVVSSLIIVTIAFLPKSIKAFLKCYGVFFGATFLLGGAMLGLSLVNSENILYINGTVYFNMTLSYLVGGILSIYGIFILVNYLLDKRAVRDELCKVKIEYNGNMLELTGFIDTGNNLSDSSSGRSVFVAEAFAVFPLFSFEEREFLKNGNYEKIPSSLYRRIRLVPAKTVSGNGILTAFLPDRVDVITDNKIYENVYCLVGITNERIANGDYKVLLNKNALVEGRLNENAC